MHEPVHRFRSPHKVKRRRLRRGRDCITSQDEPCDSVGVGDLQIRSSACSKSRWSSGSTRPSSSGSRAPRSRRSRRCASSSCPDLELPVGDRGERRDGREQERADRDRVICATISSSDGCAGAGCVGSGSSRPGSALLPALGSSVGGVSSSSANALTCLHLLGVDLLERRALLPARALPLGGVRGGNAEERRGADLLGDRRAPTRSAARSAPGPGPARRGRSRSARPRARSGSRATGSPRAAGAAGRAAARPRRARARCARRARSASAARLCASARSGCASQIRISTVG